MTVLLGRTTAGTAGSDFNAAQHTAVWRFVATGSGTLATIFGRTQVANPTGVVTLGIYADSAGSAGTLLGKATAVGATGTGTFSADVSGLGISIVSGTAYWLGWRNSAENFDFLGDAGGSYVESAGTVDFPTPWPGGSAGSVDAILWGEDATTGSAGQPQPQPLLFQLRQVLRQAGLPLLPTLVPDSAPAISGVTYAKDGTVTAGSVLDPARVVEHAHAGSVTTATLLVAARAVERPRANTATAGTVTLTARAVDRPRANTVTAGTVAVGSDVFTATETGTVSTQARTVGADAATLNRANTATAGTAAAGQDVFTASETGAVVAGTRATGSAQAGFAARAGAFIAGTVTAAARALTRARANTATAGTTGTASKAGTAARTGTVTARAFVVGDDVFIATETGTFRAGPAVSGTSTTSAATVYSKTGTIVAGTALAGISARLSSAPVGRLEGAAGTSRVPEAQSATAGSEGATVTAVPAEGGLAISGVIE